MLIALGERPAELAQLDTSPGSNSAIEKQAPINSSVIQVTKGAVGLVAGCPAARSQIAIG